MEKNIQIIPESQLDTKTLEEIRKQEFVGKKKAKISKKSLITSVLVSLLALAIISFSILVVILVYNPQPIYNHIYVEQKSISQSKLHMYETLLEFNDEQNPLVTENGNKREDFAEDESYYYIPNPLDMNKVYRISKTDFSSEKIGDIPAKYLNLYDGILYFANVYENPEYEYGIYYLNVLEPSDTELMWDNAVNGMVLWHDSLFFIDAYNNNIYKRDLKTQEEHIVESGKYSEMHIFDGRIYCIKSETDRQMLCSFSDNEILRPIVEAYKGQYYIYKNKIYYQAEDGIYSIEEGEEGYTEPENIIKIPIDGKFVITDKSVIFIDKNANYKLAIYSVEDNSTKHINIDNTVDFQITDEFLIIHYVDEDNSICVTVNNQDSLESIKIF